MTCFSSKIFYLLVAALDVALLEAAWRRREPDPPAASLDVRLRHGAKVFLFLSLMRAPKRTEPVRKLRGQLHGGMLGPISGRF
jgi:hypothetical protein